MANKQSKPPSIHWPLAVGWKAKLAEFGALIVHQVPLDADNRSLHGVATQLGTASLRAIDRGLAEANGVQRVEALAAAVRDRFGKPLKSANHDSFDLHTDESFFADPARYVLLHCWRAASEGATVLADTRQLQSALARVEWLAWTQLRLPYPCGDYCSINTRGVVRFNAAECKQAQLTTTQRHWLTRFSATLQRIAIQIALRPGDLLIIDNHRFLHGRRAFAADSGRMLKRLRIADSEI